jgi:hypothetical protein
MQQAAIGRRITVQAHPDKTARPYQKNKQNRAGGMAQVIEHLPNKHKIMNSNPSIVKKTEQNKIYLSRGLKLKMPNFAMMCQVLYS